MDRIFHVVPGKGIRVLAHQLQRVGTCLLWRDFAGNTLPRYMLRTNAQGQALAEGTGLEQVGNADLVAAGRALKHALGRWPLKGRTTEGARNAHMRGLLELLSRAAILPQQMFQDRLIAPVRVEEIPVRVLRALELRHMRELEQSIHHRQRRMANAQGALGLSGVRLPRNDRTAISALKAALSLV